MPGPLTHPAPWDSWGRHSPVRSPSHTFIHSTIICAKPCTGTLRKSKGPALREPPAMHRDSVAGHGSTLGRYLCPPLPKVAQRPYDHGPERCLLTRSRGPSQQPVVCVPGHRAAPPALLPLGTPHPSWWPPTLPTKKLTVREGAIGDVEGTHGDAHKDQELKEPEPMGWGLGQTGQWSRVRGTGLTPRSSPPQNRYWER